MKLITSTIFLLLLMGCSSEPEQDLQQEQLNSSETMGGNMTNQSIPALTSLLKEAKRIPDGNGWFEIIKLPNDVYAFWEPGHVEEVNSFLIIGEDKDILYDTGMGIGDIKKAVFHTRQVEGLAQKELMVINSHNHLDHNGGDAAFKEVWTINHPWAIERLTKGVPAGTEGGFIPYWDQFQDHEGIKVPDDFVLEKFSIAPYPKDHIHFLEEGDIVDLGNRQFVVINLKSHSPDGLALYDAEHKVIFAGDSFYGSHYLSRSLELLAADLERYNQLDVEWHYSSHGAQLIDIKQHGHHLSVVRKMIKGEGDKSETSFAGIKLPLVKAEGVEVTIAGDVLLY